MCIRDRDISEAMLEVARAKLLRRATLAAGDACRFDPQALLGQPRFDRVMVSYACLLYTSRCV